MRRLVLPFLLLIVSSAAFAQIPSRPNLYDEDSLRTGKWVLLYDSAYTKKVLTKDSANFYCLVNFVKGKPKGMVSCYYLSGIKQYEGYMKSIDPDIKHGKITLFHPRGNVMEIVQYVNDTVQGDIIGYHENGQVKVRGQATDNNYEGTFEYYHLNGRLQSKGEYLNGKQNGVWEYYLDNGQTEAIVTLENGDFVGDLEVYYANGSLNFTASMKNGKKNGVYREFYENGHLYKETFLKDDVDHGLVRYYHENGRLESEGQILDGLYQGPWVFYYDNGKIASKRIYVDDKENGFLTYYHENGAKKREGNVTNDQWDGKVTAYYPKGQLKEEATILKGLYQGKCVSYFSNGQLETSKSYKNDTLHGYWQKYFENGQLWEEGNLDMDMLDGEWTVFYQNGQLKNKGPYLKGNRNGYFEYYQENGDARTKGTYYGNTEDGPFEYYHDNGLLKSKGEFDMGKAVGHWVYYHDNGALRTEGEYVNGKSEGEWKYYFPSGALKSYGNEHMGQGNGYWRYYHENGKPRMEGELVDGNREGIWKYYHENGQLSYLGPTAIDKAYGHWKYFDSNGRITSEGRWKNNLQDSIWVYYDSLGRIERYGLKVNSNEQGKWTYFVDGKKDHEKLFIGGQNIDFWTLRDSAKNVASRQDIELALKIVKEAKKYWKKDLRISNEHFNKYSRLQGEVYDFNGQYDKALYYYQKSLEEAEEKEGVDSWNYAIALGDIAQIYFNRGQYLKAIPLYEKELKIIEEIEGRKDTNYHTIVDALSTAYVYSGQYDKAFDILEADLQYRLDNVPEQHDEIVNALETIGDLKYRSDQYDECTAAYDRFFKYIGENNLEYPSNECAAYRVMAYNYGAQNMRDSAVRYYQKAIAAYKKYNLTHSTGYIYSYNGLANLYFGRGFNKMARVYGDSAVMETERNGLTNFQCYVEALLVKAKPTYSLYMEEEAYELYKKAMEKGIDNKAVARRFVTDAYLGMAVCEADLFPKDRKRTMESYMSAIALHNGDQSYSHSHANAMNLLIGKLISWTLNDEAKSWIAKMKNYLYQHEEQASFYLGSVYQKEGDLLDRNLQYDSALAAYDLSLSYYGKKKTQYAEEYCKVLRDKADSYQGRKLYNQSQVILLEALEFVKETLGEGHRQYAFTLTELAYQYRTTGNYESAITYYNQSLNLKKDLLGTDNSSYISSLLGLAITYKMDQQYDKGLIILEKIKENILASTGAYDRDYLYYLEQKADILSKQGKYQEAQGIIKEMVARSEEKFGASHIHHAYHLRETARFYIENKKWDQALYYIRPALNILERNYGRDNNEFAFCAELLTEILFTQENYKEAISLQEEVVALYKGGYGSDSYEYIESYKDLAKRYDDLGRYEEAETIYLNIIEELKEQGEEWSWRMSKIYHELGVVYRHWGKPSKGLVRFHQSISVLDTIPDIEEWEYVYKHNFIGLCHLDRQEFEQANTYLNRAVEGARKHWGIGTTYYLISSNLASLLVVKGDYSRAEKLLLEGDAEMERNKKTGDRTLIMQKRMIAQLYTAWGKMEKADAYWSQVTEVLLKRINENFEFMSESEKASFWDAYSKDFEFFKSFAVEAKDELPKVIGELYDNQLQTKSILLSASTKERRRILNSGDSILVGNYFRYIDLKESLAKAYGLTAQQLKDQQINLDSMEQAKNDLEAMMSLNSAALDDENQIKKLRWKDIQHSLKGHEAAVEIVRVRHYDAQFADSLLYVALILTSETRKQPEIVVLPNGDDLEAKWLNAYKSAIKYKATDESSYENYWQAIDEKLHGKSTVYVASDGVYSQINLNTLRRPDGSYVLDAYDLKILTSTRDILLLNKKTRKEIDTGLASLFGYPLYDLDHSSISEYVQERALDRSGKLERDIDLERFGFMELPGTKTETESIEKILDENEWDTQLFLGEEALEEQLKAVHNPDILHIATHGFFLDDLDNSKQLQLGVNTEKGRENPMLRSGLLMAGAAQTAQGKSTGQVENGIFTAYEAMNLDLNDTELVVLSACETGRGEVKSGEGVYGLQRAFQVAGTKAIVMSLWKVNDEATQMLMTNFYSNWIKGMPKADAFKQAQITVRQQFRDPYYWGAFVMIGE